MQARRIKKVRLKKKIISFLALFIMFFFLTGCYLDSDNTATLVRYPTPKIENLQLNNDKITLDISISINTSVNSDFTNYIILIGKDTDNISTEQNLSELTAFSSINYFASSTSKPNFSGNSVDTLTYSFTTSTLSATSNYQIAAIAFGYNESYGRFFDNNGWLYSTPSTAISFHKNYTTNGLSAQNHNAGGNSGYSTGSGSVVLNSLGPGAEIYFFIADYTGSFQFYIGTGSGTTIQPINNSLSLYTITELPENNYLPSGTFLPITSGSRFALKRADNSYQKIEISSVPTASAANSAISVNFNVVYSTIANTRTF